MRLENVVPPDLCCFYNVANYDKYCLGKKKSLKLPLVYIIYWHETMFRNLTTRDQTIFRNLTKDQIIKQRYNTNFLILNMYFVSFCIFMLDNFL